MNNTREQVEQSEKLYQDLVSKAWESAAFKEQLIANPKQVIGEIAGESFTLLETKNVVVEDQTDKNTIYFNIPPMPNLDDLELTEDELEKVAGGFTSTYTIGLSLVGLAIKGFRDGRADREK